MCGFCGKLNFDRDQRVDPSLISRMGESISHRGPDGFGHYLKNNIGLGHRRLSIIDLGTGQQPMSNEDGDIWAVYNGEIYNFAALRDDLRSRGHRFKSQSDTEVVVHAYEEWGERAVERFQGMFAFALWDDRNQTLLLARDRVGIKPLYYVNTGKSLVFGSEIKALLVDPSVKRRVNRAAVDRFMTFHYLPGRETLLEGIYKLDPGHYLTVHSGRVSTHQYWDLQFNGGQWTNFDAAVEALQELLGRTVHAHMISDVPVGVLLSGGVDSSGVLAYAAERAGSAIQTFTIGFPGASFADERPFARMASERYGTEHHEATLSAQDFRDFLPKYVWHMEEPVCEPPATALYYLAALARRSGVKVLLSGEGGDEAFAGYNTYWNLLMLERAKGALGPFKGALSLGLGALEGIGWRGAGAYADLVRRPLMEYYFGRTATPEGPLKLWKQRLYKPGQLVDAATALKEEPLRTIFQTVQGRSLLDHMLYVDSKSWLPDDLLVKADKMTMAASVELRVPLLDHQVLEFAASLPADFKLQGKTAKRVLKAAISPLVPQEILTRKKAGFPVPYESWLRNELSDFVSDTLLSSGAAINEYFDHREVANLVSQSQAGQPYSKDVFSLLVLEMWHGQFVDSRPEPVTRAS